MIACFSKALGNPPEPITALTPVAWYRYGIGITEAGGAVSAWADQSGNANDLAQATGANQPALQADNSILFDGVDNWMRASFTLAQPYTIYLLGRQVTFTNSDRIIGGAINGTNSELQQVDPTPNIRLLGSAGSTANTNFILNTYAAIGYVMNGASSLVQVSNTTPIMGNPGTNSAGGITLAASSATSPSAFGNVQFKEVIAFPVAHDAATRAAVITYLGTVGGVNL